MTHKKEPTTPSLQNCILNSPLLWAKSWKTKQSMFTNFNNIS